MYALLGIRKKAAYIGATIKIERVSLQIQTQSEQVEWNWMFNPTVASTFTYSDETNSAVQTAVGVTANTISGGTALTGGHLHSTSGGGGAGGVDTPIPNSLRLGSAIDNTVDEMVLCVRPVGGSTNVEIEGSITWRELA